MIDKFMKVSRSFEWFIQVAKMLLVWKLQKLSQPRFVVAPSFH